MKARSHAGGLPRATGPWLALRLAAILGWACLGLFSFVDSNRGTTPSIAAALVLAAAAQGVGLRRITRLPVPIVSAWWRAHLPAVATSLVTALTAGLLVSWALASPAHRSGVILLAVALVDTAWVLLAAATRCAPTGATPPALQRYAGRALLAAGVLAAVFWGVEGTLRLYDSFAARPLAEAYSLASIDCEIREAQPIRDAEQVAIVGPSAVYDEARSPALAGLTDKFPGVAWTAYLAQGAGPEDYARLAERQALRDRPDLVLICVSAAADQAHDPVAPAWLEAESSRVYQAASLALGSVPRRPTAARDSEPNSLRACRIEADPGVERRWQATRESFRRMVGSLREQGVEVAVVVVPEPYQLDPIHWRRAVRRSGGQLAEYDIRLPQHRWTTLGVDLDTTVIDLLPAAQAHMAESQRAAPLVGWLERRWQAPRVEPVSSVVSRQ